MYTGKEESAQTKAGVYLNLFGQHGDFGKRLLFKSHNRVPFQRGQVSIKGTQAVVSLCGIFCLFSGFVQVMETWKSHGILK